MKLSLGFSPCPNDTFIFDALVNKKIDSGDLKFETVLADVESLNLMAFEAELDVTKLSFPALFQNLENYSLLNSGGAMGNGVGPLVVAKPGFKIEEVTSHIQHLRVAIPGKNTTANMLFDFAFPDAKKKLFMVFSQIEDAVLMENADLGVIIHESRFTYQNKGLIKIMDLGEFWEKAMDAPIPLGGIGINRALGEKVAERTEALIRESLQYSWKIIQWFPTT